MITRPLVNVWMHSISRSTEAALPETLFTDFSFNLSPIFVQMMVAEAKKKKRKSSSRGQLGDGVLLQSAGSQQAFPSIQLCLVYLKKEEWHHSTSQMIEKFWTTAGDDWPTAWLMFQNKQTQVLFIDYLNLFIIREQWSPQLLLLAKGTLPRWHAATRLH